jgi:hypothetical protein
LPKSLKSGCERISHTTELDIMLQVDYSPINPVEEKFPMELVMSLEC